jgi:beta-lactamase class A
MHTCWRGACWGSFLATRRSLYHRLPRLLVFGAAMSATATNDAVAQGVTLQTLEHRSGGRLGVLVIDESTGKTLEYRGDERFPLMSTFKLPLVVAILTRIDSGVERLDRQLTIPPGPLLPNSPITTQRGPRARISVRELCAAVIRYSDNTGANMLLQELGGPSGLTVRMRALHDTVFRLDRTEPSLNESLPGDDRDTSTPRAMAALLRRLVDGAILSDRSRRMIDGWLRSNTTGDARFRAGVPIGWAVGDKTGTATVGSNDIGILYPPTGKPIIVAAYLTQSTAPPAVRDSVLASVATWAVHAGAHSAAVSSSR